MSNGTGTPGVTTRVATGNLLRQIKVLDGVPGLVGTAQQPENIGVVRRVNGYDDAVAKGYTAEDEPLLNAALLQFYNELGGNMELHIMGVEDTMTMQQMCTVTNANGIKKLLAFSLGKVNLVAICREPSELYNAGTGFLDTDVANAVTASKALCQYQQGINRPVRVLIEGRVVDIEEVPYEPNTGTNTFAGVVLGNDKPDGHAAVGLALGRACKYPAHVKLGNGLNGALSIVEAYIGDKPLEEFYPEELDAFSDAGYIIPTHRDGAAGYFFGIDNMAGDDDFHILAHGRIIDKAQRIATATANPFLESTIRVAQDGKVNDADAAYLEDVIKAQLSLGLSGQVSGVDCIIPLDQNVIETAKLGMQVKVQPLGYLTWIVIDLGLTKTL